VVFTPQQQPGEDPASYSVRVQLERTLMLHAGFNPDD
jgi:hypothetical protein